LTIEDLSDIGVITKIGHMSTKSTEIIKSLNIDIRPFETIQEFLYSVKHQILEPPLRECGKPIKFKYKSYKTFCSVHCSSGSHQKKNKIKETNLERYGSECSLQNEEVKQKIKETNLKKYGTLHSSQSEQVKQKAKETNLERYGSECSLQNEEVNKKTKVTNLKKYGHEHQLKSDQVKQKVKETSLIRYGYECSLQNEEVKQKIKETNLKKYGVINPAMTEQVKDKIKETNLKKCGTPYSSQSHIKNFVFFNNKRYIAKNFITTKDGINKFKRGEYMEFFNVSLSNANITMLKFGVSPDNKWKTQVEIFNFLGGNKSFLLNDRSLIKPKEIDIISYEHKFGVEYDGLMFHSFGKSKYSMFDNSTKEKLLKSVHEDKTDLCEENGFQLFHIFENEWLQKREIWESVLNSKLGKTKRIYARKCDIMEVSSRVASNFENENHLQGEGLSSIRIGLYHAGSLVSLMTFGKSRFSKEYQYELIRFCSKLNHTVVGAGSKLLKYFEKNYSPESLVTYANRRWSQGNLYDAIGFTYSHSSKANYFYFKDGSMLLESRNKCQKHKLHKILDIFDKDLSETENMYNNGYRKIYDSGNKVYFKKYEVK